jgi:hypothetical protein
MLIYNWDERTQGDLHKGMKIMKIGPPHLRMFLLLFGSKMTR